MLWDTDSEINSMFQTLLGSNIQTVLTSSVLLLFGGRVRGCSEPTFVCCFRMFLVVLAVTTGFSLGLIWMVSYSSSFIACTNAKATCKSDPQSQPVLLKQKVTYKGVLSYLKTRRCQVLSKRLNGTCLVVLY